MKHDDVEKLPLPQAVSLLLDECRMVLPGLQALFGFQLIAVFNQRFSQELSLAEQEMHLRALGLVAISGALVMIPAAYHHPPDNHAKCSCLNSSMGNCIMITNKG